MASGVQSAIASEHRSEQPQLAMAESTLGTPINGLEQSKKRKRKNQDVLTLPAINGTSLDTGPSGRTRSKLRLPDQGIEVPSDGNEIGYDHNGTGHHLVESLLAEFRPAKSRRKKGSPKDADKIDPAELHRGKPQPSGAPVVWSERRAALCDALPYFRAHQGSLHTNDGLAISMFIDSKVGDHDIFSSQIIISTM